MSNDKREYYMHYTCSNCGRGFTQHFEYGERAYQGKCPICGVSPIKETVPWDIKKDL